MTVSFTLLSRSIARVCINTKLKFSEGGWKIGEITIKEKTLSNYFVGMDSKEYGYIGSVDRPFNSSTSFESKFLLEAIKIDSVMEEYFKDFTNEVVMHPVKEPDAKSNGLWSLTVTSAPYDQVR